MRHFVSYSVKIVVNPCFCILYLMLLLIFSPVHKLKYLHTNIVIQLLKFMVKTHLACLILFIDIPRIAVNAFKHSTLPLSTILLSLFIVSSSSVDIDIVNPVNTGFAVLLISY